MRPTQSFWGSIRALTLPGYLPLPSCQKSNPSRIPKAIFARSAIESSEISVRCFSTRGRHGHRGVWIHTRPNYAPRWSAFPSIPRIFHPPKWRSAIRKPFPLPQIYRNSGIPNETEKPTPKSLPVRCPRSRFPPSWAIRHPPLFREGMYDLLRIRPTGLFCIILRTWIISHEFLGRNLNMKHTLIIPVDWVIGRNMFNIAKFISSLASIRFKNI